VERRFRILLTVLGAAGAGFTIFVATVLVRFGSAHAVPEIAIRALVSLLLCAVGLWIGAMKPDSRATRGAALGMFFTGMLWVRDSIRDYIPILPPVDAVIFYVLDVAYPLHFVFGLRFFVEFPPGAPPSRVLHAVRAANDVIGVSLLALAKLIELRAFVAIPRLGVLDVIYDNRSFYTSAALLAMLVAGVRNYRKAPDRDARRRVRWIVFGAVVAMAPEMLAKLLKALGHDPHLDLFTVVAVAVMPITFAYAVVKHQVLDIRVVVGRGIQYLLARNVLRVLVALPALALALDVALDPNRTIRQLFFDGWPRLLLLVLAALALRYNAPLGQFVDRLFFRQAVSVDDVLERVLVRVKAADSLADVSTAVAAELEMTFHPRSIELIPPEIAPSELLSRMARTDQPVDHEGALAVPLRSVDDSLGGILLLGKKSSGEAWGEGDRRLLGAIAAQVGTVLEARSLRERVAEERRVTRQAMARLNPMTECPLCGRCDDGETETCAACGARLEIGLPVPRTIDDKYRLERRIGRGGMGAVYKAHDLRLGREVAVKVMVGGRLGDRNALRRFEREARATAKLAHPGIVAVHDFGRIGQEGAYLVMELLEGSTLRAELDRLGGPVSPPVVAGWFGPIFDAVAAAHAAGVVHRDLKPENVFVLPNGGVKVLDFGLARISQPGERSSVTVPGVLLGTLGYISPEQFEGKEADARADVFALGVMVVEAVTGGPPFHGRTVAELAASVLRDDVHLRGDDPAIGALDAVVSRCLARDRRVRYASVILMAQALLPALRRCPPLLRDGRTASLAHADTQLVK
jgi:tRNA A-37 threonylcarbamoyl transferase component Bud32/rRNA maturation protein Nop10